jgi:hypothetical protein
MRVLPGLARSMAAVRAAGGGLWAAARYEPASDAWRRRYLRRHPDVAGRLFPRWGRQPPSRRNV